MNRPVGITILAAFFVVGGLVLLLGAGLVGFLSYGLGLMSLVGFADVSSLGVTGVLGAVCFIMAGFYFVMAYGFLKMKGWAFTIQFVLSALSFLVALMTMSWTGLIVPAIILWYLYTKRSLFPSSWVAKKLGAVRRLRY